MYNISIIKTILKCVISGIGDAMTPYNTVFLLISAARVRVFVN